MANGLLRGGDNIYFKATIKELEQPMPVGTGASRPRLKTDIGIY
jgi:hypothetical protein